MFRLTPCKLIGIKPRSEPQISEQAPKNKPSLFKANEAWFNLPGTASTFTPKAGIVQQWITSPDEIITLT